MPSEILDQAITFSVTSSQSTSFGLKFTLEPTIRTAEKPIRLTIEPVHAPTGLTGAELATREDYQQCWFFYNRDGTVKHYAISELFTDDEVRTWVEKVIQDDAILPFNSWTSTISMSLPRVTQYIAGKMRTVWMAYANTSRSNPGRLRSMSIDERTGRSTAWSSPAWDLVNNEEQTEAFVENGTTWVAPINTLFYREMESSRGLTEQLLRVLPPSLRGPCSVCGSTRAGHRGIDHVTCTICERQIDRYNESHIQSRHYPEYTTDYNYYTLRICVPCQNDNYDYSEWLGDNGYTDTCSLCQIWLDPHEDSTHTLDNSHERACNECYENEYTFCEVCENRVSWGNYYDDEGMCTDCYENGNGIMQWDYVPDPLIFHPFPPVHKPKKGLYFGMEIECSFNSGYPTRGLQSYARAWLQTVPADLLYIKSDSSVSNGFEIVTHPFEPEWGLENLPFQAFDQLLEDGARDTHQSAGTHVHISKAAFTPAHLWKFITLHEKMMNFCGVIGGRGTDAGYGALSTGHFTKNEKLQVAKAKGQLGRGLYKDRHSGLNLQPPNTIEVRYPASGVSSFKIKKNIQWLLALYEYSDALTIHQVEQGALTDPGYLMNFIIQNVDRWPELNKFIEDTYPRPKQLERT